MTDKKLLYRVNYSDGRTREVASKKVGLALIADSVAGGYDRVFMEFQDPDSKDWFPTGLDWYPVGDFTEPK